MAYFAAFLGIFPSDGEHSAQISRDYMPDVHCDLW